MTVISKTSKRILDNKKVDSAGCWKWQLSTVRGYGQISISGRMKKAHRVSYEEFVGPILDGLQIDHLCGVTDCVNPDHLEAVTPRENVMRSNNPAALNHKKERCKRGHRLEPIWNATYKKWHRRCTVCHNAKNAEGRIRRRLNAGS